MTTAQRLERDLPLILDELAMSPYPDYIDGVLSVTQRKHQRPGWTLPERWLPMTAITTRAAAVPRTPLRLAALVALVILALVVAALLIAGSQRPLPAPFGQAADGMVAFASNGDIYTADPISGAARAVVATSDVDAAPVWSRDGTHFVFAREIAGTDGGRLYTARADGSDVTAVMRDPLSGLAAYSFSPNGRQIVFLAGPQDARQMWIANVDGTGVRSLYPDKSAADPAWLPPNGMEVVFASNPGADVANGLYAVDVATGAVRTIVQPVGGIGVGWVRPSPDGSRIAYSAAPFGGDSNGYRVHVVTTDGKTNITLPIPQGAMFEDAPNWSNDGTRLVVTRGYSARNQDVAVAVVPADGSGVGVESARRVTGCCDTETEWAPDDRFILVSPEDLDGNFTQNLLLDPSTGLTKPAPWAATTTPDWQRLAP
jgi:Tol biopolymer transport system component